MARVSRKKQNTTSAAKQEAVRLYNVAFYARLSVENNGKDSDSIESQLALLDEYVAARPFLVKVATFIDNGYTGTDFLRPEFTRMMEAVKNGIVDCIMVKDLSRLGRNYIEAGEFIEKICPFYGLRFISVIDGYDTATATSNNQLTASLANIVNDYYAKDISRKVTTAMQIKMENGDYIGNYAPHGYLKDPANKNHLIVNEETAPVIRQIYEWRAEGISYMGINAKLNEAGVSSPSQYKVDHGIHTNNNKKPRTILWNKHAITDILCNIVYIGHLAQKKGSQCLYAGLPYHRTPADEWVVVKNTHEPIISEALFNKVQEINRLASETAKANSGKYDYLPKANNIYGKKFVCADCGAVIKLYRSISTKKDAAYFTYKCPTFSEHGKLGCTDRKLRQADMDEAVLSVIKKQMDVFIDMQKALERLLAMKKAKLRNSGNSQELAALRQKLANKQSVFSGTYLELKEGLLTQEEFTHTRQILSAEMAALEQRIAEVEGIKVETEEQVIGNRKWKAYIQQYYDAKQMTSEMVDAFIDSIKLNEDNTLDIRLNYMDEFAEIMTTCEQLRKEVA